MTENLNDEHNPYATPRSGLEPKPPQLTSSFEFDELRMGWESDAIAMGFYIANSLTFTLAGRIFGVPNVYEKQHLVAELLLEEGFKKEEMFTWMDARDNVRARVRSEIGLENAATLFPVRKAQRAARLEDQIAVDNALERKALITGKMVWLLFMDRNPSDSIEVTKDGTIREREAEGSELNWTMGDTAKDDHTARLQKQQEAAKGQDQTPPSGQGR